MNKPWINVLPHSIRQRLEGHHTLQRIFGNTGWLFTDKMLRMGVGLLVGVWVARYLGPAQFGTYSYALAFVALFSAFATLGLDNIVIRDIVRDPSYKDEILGTAFILKLIGGGSALLLATVGILLLRPNDSLTIWLVGIIATGMIFQAFDTIDFWFQSQVASKYAVYAKNTAFLLFALVKIGLILVNAPLIAFALAGVGEIAVGAFGLVIAYKSHGHMLKAWRGSLKWANKLLKNSWSLILGGLSVMVYMRIDQIMLGDMVGSEAVGIYSAATRISEVWYFIPMAITSSVFPSIIQAKSVNDGLYYHRLQRLFSLMTALSFVIAIMMTFLSTKVVTILFGKAFSPAGPVLAIHIWASLFVFLGSAQSSWDITENLTKLALLRTFLGAIINIVLNIILIPHYLAIGAAVATIVSQAFSAYILNAFHKKTQIIFLCQTRSFLFYKYLYRGILK
ncbi:MAG: hypothetical protein DDT22_00505 [candidate division WS2 bacterium]|nr:hypothetical protein [Bacillota bacterium]MBT9174840.1 hypothetical protein [Candidatus Lithacetigena glycinireducens]